MRWAFLNFALDMFHNRLPGSLAMMRATEHAISVHHNESLNLHYCRVEFLFPDGKSASQAYRAMERIYRVDEAPEAANN